ncbi:hypothetical protein [Hyphococcus sp.]|uniref:hypothetical protein n=1 Tax=Hyphococcus sp. TaxID=2038636 RepID=UPI003D09FCB3
MTTRRTILQGVASLVAPAEIEIGGALDASPSDSPFGILIDEYREMLNQLDRLFAVRNRVEKIAFAQKGDARDCSELRLIDQKANAWYQTEKEMIRLASRTRAASVDEVVQKLILWRLVQFDQPSFNNACDMIPFSAYRDLLFLAGRESLTKDSDEKALAIVWDDEAFNYSADDDDDDFDDGEPFYGEDEEDEEDEED